MLITLPKQAIIILNYLAKDKEIMIFHLLNIIDEVLPIIKEKILQLPNCNSILFSVLTILKNNNRS